MLITPLFLSPLYLNSQSSDTSGVQFFVDLEPLISIDTVAEYLADLNSSEVWSHEYSHLALWQVDSFPFTTADGEMIFDINGVIKRSVRKTKIKGADFNILSVLEDMSSDSVGTCFSPMDFSSEQGSNAVIISILDTGINPDMSNSSTPDLNYNLINYSGYDYINDDPIPDDEHGHGTHIAGIIHSITHAIDTAGTTITFDIRKTHNNLGQGFMSGVVKGLLDAVDAGAKVINMSFGAQDTLDMNSFYPLRQAINFAQEQNVIIIAATGNEGMDIGSMNSTVIPAAFPEANIISVSSIGCNDSLSTYSNFGELTADIGVLGERIPGPGLTSGIEYRSGTSHAAAILSAVAALISSQSSTLDVEKLKCTLINGASEIDYMDTLLYSGGKLDPTNAAQLFSESFPDYTISNTSNDGVGSLRYAFEENCSVEKIYFDLALDSDTIIIFDAPIYVDREIKIIGNEMDESIIFGLNIPTFIINPFAELKLEKLTIKSNSVNPAVKNLGILRVKNDVKIE